MPRINNRSLDLSDYDFRINLPKCLTNPSSDEVIRRIHDVGDSFIGAPNTVANRAQLNEQLNDEFGMLFYIPTRYTGRIVEFDEHPSEEDFSIDHLNLITHEFHPQPRYLNVHWEQFENKTLWDDDDPWTWGEKHYKPAKVMETE